MNYKIISKFIKDVSFEIPNIETFTMLQKEISKYNLNFDVKSKPFKNKIVEVNTVLRLTPNQDVKHKMLVEINLTALVSVEKNLDNKQELEKIFLIKVPTDVYPILHETFIFLFAKAGIKNINVENTNNTKTKLYKKLH